MTVAKPLFSGTRLTCARGGRVLFQNLSFALAPGDVAHLSGPNGSGKTSLLRVMAGVLEPAAGKIGPADFAFLPADDRALKSAETAGATLAFWAKVTGAGGVAEALAKAGLLDLKDVPVRRLSAGQRRRLSLARVFLSPAPLWLLDEPLNGLDMASYDLFITALNAHSAAGGVAVVASHYAVPPPKQGRLHHIDIASPAAASTSAGGAVRAPAPPPRPRGRTLAALVERDVGLSFLRGAEGLSGLFFFAVVASLFPFALGPELLKAAAPGIVWIAALLAALLSVEGIWHRDFEDGTLDLLLLARRPAIAVVAAKTLAHWLVAGLPLIPAAALAALMLDVPPASLVVPLIPGTLYMSLLGGFGAVLTFGARRPGVLMVLLILPLFTPMLILGVMAAAGGSLSALLMLQAALVVAALGLAPAAAAACLERQVRS